MCLHILSHRQHVEYHIGQFYLLAFSHIEVLELIDSYLAIAFPDQ